METESDLVLSYYPLHVRLLSSRGDTNGGIVLFHKFLLLPAIAVMFNLCNLFRSPAS